MSSTTCAPWDDLDEGNMAVNGDLGSCTAPGCARTVRVSTMCLGDVARDAGEHDAAGPQAGGGARNGGDGAGEAGARRARKFEPDRGVSEGGLAAQKLTEIVGMRVDDLADFESSRFTLESADEALTDFRKCVKHFTDQNIYTIVNRLDAKTGQKTFSFRFEERIPGKIRVLASRIVTDVKHSLDQALSDAAMALGRSDSNGLHFPIGNSQQNFEGELKRRCRNVHGNILNVIRKFEPYEGGNTSFYRFLSLAGRAKHQRILKVSILDSGLTLSRGKDDFIFIPAGRLGVLGWNDEGNQLDFLRIPEGKAYRGAFRPEIQISLEVEQTPLSGEAAIVFQSMIILARTIVNDLEIEILSSNPY